MDHTSNDLRCRAEKKLLGFLIKKTEKRTNTNNKATESIFQNNVSSTRSRSDTSCYRNTETSINSGKYLQVFSSIRSLFFKRNFKKRRCCLNLKRKKHVRIRDISKISQETVKSVQTSDAC